MKMAENKNTIVWISQSPVQRNNILHQGNTANLLQMELVRGSRARIQRKKYLSFPIQLSVQAPRLESWTGIPPSVSSL